MGTVKFWRVYHPDYETDYDFVYINGGISHPYGLPGVRCSRCGPWGGCRILPLPCPEVLRTRRELNDPSPIPVEAHRALQEEILAALVAEGHDIQNLRLKPSDTFQPPFLEVHSRPTADFLWASMGSVVVSKRMRDFFLEHEVKGATFVQVNIRRVGTFAAELSPPIPLSGEPEDIFDQVETTTDTEDVGPYYEMIVSAESELPPGVEIRVCSTCGRKGFDNKARRLEMHPHMWKGDDIFLLATTLWVIVTDELKRRLEAMKPTNVVFQDSDLNPLPT